MKERFEYFIKMKKLIWFFGILSIILVVLYIFTYNLKPILSMSVEFANSIWSIIINLSCGYLISLIFYIMLVFNSDYNNYKKKIHISKRVYHYYLRISTYIGVIFDILTVCSDCMDIHEYIYRNEYFGNIKDRILPYDVNHDIPSTLNCLQAVKQAIYKVNENLNRIEPYLSYLNQEAIDIFIKLQDTYIFENVDNKDEKIFIGTMGNIEDLLEIYENRLPAIGKKGNLYIVDEK